MNKLQAKLNHTNRLFIHVVPSKIITDNFMETSM